jgi:predicted nucleic acid-binding protein
MLILADSGILIRLQEPTDPQHGSIFAAVQSLLSQGHGIATATQNMAEFWNVCTRPGVARGGLGLDNTETDRRARIIENTLLVLSEPPTAYAIWRRLVVSLSILGKQVHDARLVALMQAHGITHILTLNGKDFARYPGITVIDPTSAAGASPPLAIP